MISPITFPIIVISEFANVGGDILPDIKVVETFAAEEAFSVADEMTVRHGLRRNALIFDSAGRSWKVRGHKNKGVVKKGSRIPFLHAPTMYRLEYDLADLGPYGLDELKDRLCQAVDSDPGGWADEELVAGETGAPYDEQRLLNEQKARIWRAQDLLDLIAVVSDPYGWQLAFGP
jgi:hypothetical protein